MDIFTNLKKSFKTAIAIIIGFQIAIWSNNYFNYGHIDQTSLFFSYEHIVRTIKIFFIIWGFCFIVPMIKNENASNEK